MKENFDDIIRRRWEEQQFPIDPGHREEIEKLLDDRKRRKGFPIWWFSGAGGVLLLSVLIYWLSANTPANQQKGLSNEVLTPLRADQTVIEKNNTTSQPNHSSIDDQSVAAKNDQQIIASSQAASNSEVEKIKNQNIQKQPDAVSIKNKSSQSKSKNNAVEKSYASKDNVSAKNTNPGIKTDPSANKPGEYYKVELDNPTAARIVSNTATIQVYPDSVQYDPWTGEIYPTTSDGHFKFYIPALPTGISELEVINSNHPGKITPVVKVTHPIYLIGEAGTGMVLASHPHYNAGFKVNVGGGLGYQLLPKLHLQWTAGYQMQDGGFEFTRTSVVNQVGFGLRSEFNELRPDRLHYVYSKIGVMYRMHRHALNMHVGANYLYGAQGTITVHTQDQVTGEDNIETNKAWLNTDGLRSVNVWGDVSYGYLVFPGLYLQGGVAIHPSSITVESEALSSEGYYWDGKTSTLQPFITLNYLLHGKL